MQASVARGLLPVSSKPLRPLAIASTKPPVMMAPSTWATMEASSCEPGKRPLAQRLKLTAGLREQPERRAMLQAMVSGVGPKPRATPRQPSPS